MKKILVLGGSSYIGRHLVSALGHERCITTYFNTCIKNGIYFDINSMDLKEIVSKPKIFSHAVILIANSNIIDCATDKYTSYRINVERICLVLKQLKKWNIKPIFTSTDHVFDGIKGNYTETDDTNPMSTYGKHKAEVENVIT